MIQLLDYVYSRKIIMTKLRWGLLAAGNIAKAFARGVQHSKTGLLVAVGARTLDSANKFADEFGVPRRHGSYDALLADPEVDAVYISTPHPHHAEWAIKAAEAGKHILCEKPLTLNYPQAMAVIEAAREHDVFLMEAFMYRCHPQTAKLVALIKEDIVGEVALIDAKIGFRARFDPEHRLFSNALGGGGILDVGCYPVSMARLVAGAALGRDFADPVKVTGVGKLNAITGSDDYAIGSLLFEGGIVAQVSTSVTLNQRWAVQIFGSEGSILVTSPWIPSRSGGTSDIVIYRNGEPPRVVEVQTDEWLYGIEADTVALNIDKRQAPSPAMSWDDTLGNMRTLDQWRAAIGLTYAQEKADAPEMKVTVAKRPLASKAVGRGVPMPTGTIGGVGKPMSRLILGVDNQESIAYGSAVFDDFFEHGGNVFDTAFIYMGGRAEGLLGQWQRNRNIREQIVILDKGAHTPFCTPEDLDKQFKISLERLQTDYVDLYAMHRDNPDVPAGEFIDVMDAHRAAGRMKIYGGSNWTMERFEAANDYAAKNGKQGLSFLSNNFTLARMIEPPWAGCMSASAPDFKAWLTEKQVPLLPWSSQARGFFLDDTSPTFTADPERVRCWFSDDNFERLARARELAQQYNVMAINIALAYVLRQPFPTFPLIGPRTLRELRTSLPALQVALTDDEVRWLNLEM
jgi:predicted dehydrogenase/diketogulonate reductase-like aldo/keto reductase